MFVIKSDFMGSFKLGDNINHSLRVLALLYNQQSNGTLKQQMLLCKPIIIIIASVCEAVLYDFHLRIRTYTFEGVRNIAQEMMLYVRSKKIDEFAKYIASAKKHDLFDAADTKFYEALDSLRKLRNRIHIQNPKNHFEPDDGNAFTLERQKIAEKVLEKVMKTMASKYSRDRNLCGYVADFELPWNEYFESQELT